MCIFFVKVISDGEESISFAERYESLHNNFIWLMNKYNINKCNGADADPFDAFLIVLLDLSNQVGHLIWT